MAPETSDKAQLIAAIESLRKEIARLSARTTALETLLKDKNREPLQRPVDTPIAESLSDDLRAVIAAAIAAYLGVKPHIHQIRLLGSNPWAQQGRVTIQASHAQPIHHR